MATRKEKENKWTKSICEKLKLELDADQYEISCLTDIPYAVSIKDIKTANVNFKDYEVDLIIQEKVNDRLVPRLIIESKYETITTHDAITYSAKAKAHKTLFNGLRYGLMIGASKEKCIGSRVLYHGSDFDFMIAFSEDCPPSEEWQTFVKIVKRNLEISPILEKLMEESRKKNKKKYFCIDKETVFYEK